MTSGWDLFLHRVRAYEDIQRLLGLDSLGLTADEVIDSVRHIGLPDSIIRYDNRFGVTEVKYPGYAERMEDFRFALRMSVSASVARLGAGSVCNVIDMRSRRKTGATSKKGKFGE